MKTSNYQDYSPSDFAVVTPLRETAEELYDLSKALPAIDLSAQSQAEVKQAIGEWIDSWTLARRRLQADLDAIDPYPQPSHVWDPRSPQEVAQQQHDFALEADYWWLL